MNIKRGFCNQKLDTSDRTALVQSIHHIQVFKAYLIIGESHCHCCVNFLFMSVFLTYSKYKSIRIYGYSVSKIQTFVLVKRFTCVAHKQVVFYAGNIPE